VSARFVPGPASPGAVSQTPTKIEGDAPKALTYDPGEPKDRPETEEEKEARLKYSYPRVRYREGNMPGTGASAEATLENAEVWNRFGHNPDESAQNPPQSSDAGRLPFKDLK
jgi:hypothetical protein